MYFVEGGIYTGTDFTTLEPGTEERYGPFDNHDDAVSEWNGRTWAKVDICCHRLTIREV
jgi:hypothetical protein